MNPSAVAVDFFFFFERLTYNTIHREHNYIFFLLASYSLAILLRNRKPMAFSSLTECCKDSHSGLVSLLQTPFPVFLTRGYTSFWSFMFPWPMHTGPYRTGFPSELKAA